MTLLFDQHQRTESSFSVKSIPEQGGLDTVLVGRELWALLCTSVTDRLFLSITSKERPIQTISCWAALDETTVDLSIPPDWLNHYHHIFRASHLSSHKPLTVVVAEPICLTEVVITALSNEAFDITRSAHLSFENWLFADRPILRQGSTHAFSPELPQQNGKDSAQYRHSYYFRVDMAQPVQQGFAQRGKTRFVVTSTEDLVGNESESGTPREEDSESDQDGVEINEGFLAGSLLVSVSPPAGAERPPLLPSTNHISVDSDPSASDVAFRSHSLSRLIHAQDDWTLYVRTVDLAHLGVLNGDWGFARSSDVQRRLVRIVANDDLVPATGIAMGSPVLLYNLFQSLPPPRATIHLRASSFGSHPPLSTASNVTLARIASPFSTDRSHEPRLLQALRTHFDLTKRLVKQGDLVAVGIDSDALHNFKQDDAQSGEVMISDYRHPDPSVRFDQVGFFLVVDVEPSMVSNGISASDRSMPSDVGCWVNSTVTRVVQTGIEHSRIPDAGYYMGSVGKFLPPSDHQSSPHLFGRESPFGKLLTLSSATLLPHAIDLNLNLSILLKGSRGTGKFTVAKWVAQRLGMHLLEVNCYDILERDDEKTKTSLKARFEKASVCSPCILVLRHIDAFVQTTQVTETEKELTLANILRECIADLPNAWRESGHPILVIGTVSEPDRVPAGILACFKHEVVFEAPNESERLELLHFLLEATALAPDVSLSNLATQTAAMVASDLVDLVARAKVKSLERAMRTTNYEGSLSPTIALTSSDFELALSDARASYSASIGAPKIPSVSWDDVGGLEHVKSDILDTIQLPLDHPELFADGLKKRSGILLYGPPGTGKTLLAKAVATSCSLNFFSVKGPELLNMYIGESEANVRRVFQRARDAKPCVIFFDELDSVAPKRGNHGDSGGVMDRIVSQLLAELDGISAGKGSTDVFVIGATNRPDLLDPALLRPGRFDRMLYLGVSDSHSAQINILEALTRKFRLEPGVNLSLLAEQCPFTFSGADFYALCADAMLKAMSRKAMELEVKLEEFNSKTGGTALTPQYYIEEMVSSKDKAVLVSQLDFEQALQDLVPSVTQSELDEYANIQRRFSRDIVNDDG